MFSFSLGKLGLLEYNATSLKLELLEYYFAPIDQIGNIPSCAVAEQLMSFF